MSFKDYAIKESEIIFNSVVRYNHYKLIRSGELTGISLPRDPN